MDKLKGAKYFSKMDVCWGYNNIRIKEGDEWKATFKTNWGLFEPTVMFFGMCNSPARFQSMMDASFEDIINQGCTVIYMDDIMNFSNDIDILENLDKQVLLWLWEMDLFLKLKKCKFKRTQMEYLGMVIEEGKISMDPVKLKGIKDWPIPTTVKQVQSFLGFGNFYRKFIHKYLEIAKPLNDLLKKDKPFDWTKECQKAFEDLKTRFTAEPVLWMPDQTQPFKLRQMPPSMQLAQYWLKQMQMAIDILWLSCPKLSLRLNRTTRFMTGNFLVLFRL